VKEALEVAVLLRLFLGGSRGFGSLSDCVGGGEAFCLGDHMWVLS